MKKSNLKPIDIVFAILGSICILIFVIHYSSLYIHAESSYFPMGQNDNNLFSETALNYINSHYDSENNYIFARSYGTLSGGRPAYCVFYWSKNSDTMYYSELLNNGYQFSLYKSGNANPTMKYFYVNNGTCTEYTWTQANWNQNFQNQNSSLYNTSISFVSNFQVYTNSNKEKVVLKYGDSPFEPAQGHATQNNFDNNDNITSNGHAQQPTTPTFPTFPTITIDTTNVESLLESIFNILDSIGDFVGECFSVFFSWLVGVLQNGFQSVINTIRDFADSFYNNMLSLFEPIAQNIEYLVQPISSSVIYDNISSTSLISNIGSIQTSLNTFSNSFNNLDEPTTYTIPIHLENITMFGTLTTQYIDLSVINPVKNIIRVFAWAMVTYGLFITIVDSISNYINGGQDE